MVNDPELCAVPDCNQPRAAEILGWHGNDLITSAYCQNHGPSIRNRHCPECGQVTDRKRVWPDGIPPAGVVKGKVGTLTL